MKEYKQKILAFTLIELLVVIVIIGILATVSIPLFGEQSSKAKIAKYRAERAQASKERYEECIEIQTQHCGPDFIIYSNSSDGSKLYKKDINSPMSDRGEIIPFATGIIVFP